MAKLKIRKLQGLGLETLKPDKTIPRGRLSNSAISTYLKCPKQYEYAYVEKIVLPPEIALEEGSSHHDALKATNETFIKRKKFLKKNTLIECFSDSFSDRAKKIPKLKWTFAGEKKDDVLRRGKMMLENYHDNYQPKSKPVKCEERVELMIGGVPFLGFIDVIEKNKVIDYKAVKQAKSQGDADNDLQLTIYSKATKIKKVEFCCLTKTKNADVKVISSTRNDRDFKNLNAIVVGVVDAIRKGSFPMCDPTGWLCSAKWCGYYRVCKGK